MIIEKKILIQSDEFNEIFRSTFVKIDKGLGIE